MRRPTPSQPSGGDQPSRRSLRSDAGGDDARAAARAAAREAEIPVETPPRHVARRSRVTKRTRRRRIVWWTAGSLAVVLIAVIAFAATTYFRVVGNISENVVARPGSTSTSQAPTIPNWDGAVNLLIMGSDTRTGQTTGDYGQADESGARSDVMMVLHVSADHKNATLISIPRDTMMAIPQCTKADGTVVDAQSVAQINGALDNGPFCSLDAIKAFTGLDIDHFIVVDFDAVIGMTDAIGGVDVCVAEDVDDPYSGLQLTAGEHTIQGAQALAFLRTRHGFGDGSDLGRISAQQTFLSSLARKVKSAGTLTNPVALFNLADSATKSITVDEGLGNPAALVGLAGTLAGVDLNRMVLIQLPVEDYLPDPNRVQPIADQSAAIFAALKADQPLTFASDPGTGTPSDAPTDTPADGSTEAPAAPPVTSVALPDQAKGQTAADATCAK
ncbi:LCP family protein [Plantibacter sp. Mn2098]|uniref:LCP family protein n=1 Tax=Plantibacter sp. Mn2098 TaxID=3395266 RepID=UPI003BE968B9